MKKETLNGIIAGSIILALGGAFYFAFKNKGGVPNPNPNPNPYDPNGGGGIPTSNLDFRTMANNLFNAMDGYGTGNTDIETELKKLKSKADWFALVDAYGVRTLNCGSYNPFCDDFTGDLEQCLQDELDSDETKDVNEILNKIGVSI